MNGRHALVSELSLSLLHADLAPLYYFQFTLLSRVRTLSDARLR